MWRWSNFSVLTIFEFINRDKVTFLSAGTSPNFSHFPRQVKHVRFPSISYQRETRKIFSIISMAQRIVRTRSSIFNYLIDMNIHTWNLPVCNSAQYIYIRVYVTFSLFFKREQLFRGTCFLLASNMLHHKLFPMKIGSLHGNGTGQTCKE